MAERAVRAVKRPSNAHLLQQQRRAARDVPLCGPQLRLAWAAFGIGLAFVLLSMCLMIGGAASSNTVYGGKGSTNLTVVYVGIVFLVVGLVALIFFGFRFARVRQSQKSEYIRRDSGHDNAAFPAYDAGQAIPMTSKFATPSLPESLNDSAYSSLALPSNMGSELSARRLHSSQSQRPLPPDAEQSHRRNSHDPQRPAARPGPSQPSSNSASAMGRTNGAESQSQRPQPSTYYPTRPDSMVGQQRPSYLSQGQRQHSQGPTGAINRNQMYTEHKSSSNYPEGPSPRSVEQPSTSQPRSGRPPMSSGNIGSSVAVSGHARLSQGPPPHAVGPVARNYRSASIPVDLHPPPTSEHDAAFHATPRATVHDPYENRHIHESRGAGAYDSSSSGTII